ncbi:uncharacterized protein LOC113492933 [Trichoplusia ni]|uniref:Uncharacterized protein LOC113492933 n=1 Tax=Trichoplusia ni TaxID=7111 RepID=A0A7E5VDZ3_TRINI|nr:uncharacterized protein LOC113492933 [Trichoplusia ni]
MKSFIAFACFFASISAVPYDTQIASNDNNERFITGPISNGINELSQSIKDAGLDPLYIKREDSRFTLPVAAIFNYAAFIEEVLSTGLSNIKVNNLYFSYITSRLYFDFELPRVELSLGAAAARAIVFSKELEAQVSGKLVIERVRLVGKGRVTVGIISGTTVHDGDVEFTLGGVQSDIRLAIQGRDFSREINEFFSSTIPEVLESHSEEINELLEIVLLEHVRNQL